jgi:hypothetical protein
MGFHSFFFNVLSNICCEGLLANLMLSVKKLYSGTKYALVSFLLSHHAPLWAHSFVKHLH